MTVKGRESLEGLLGCLAWAAGSAFIYFTIRDPAKAIDEQLSALLIAILFGWAPLFALVVIFCGAAAQIAIIGGVALALVTMPIRLVVSAARFLHDADIRAALTGLLRVAVWVIRMPEARVAFLIVVVWPTAVCLGLDYLGAGGVAVACLAVLFVPTIRDAFARLLGWFIGSPKS